MESLEAGFFLPFVKENYHAVNYSNFAQSLAARTGPGSLSKPHGYTSC